MYYRTEKQWQVRLSEIKAAFIKRKQTVGGILGDEAENRFEVMVRYLLRHQCPSWLRGLARSSAREDWVKKIDFRMRVVRTKKDRTSEEFSIPLNTKSSLTGLEQFERENPDSDIYAIVVGRDMNVPRLKNILTDIYHEKRRRMQRF
jgi:hypothetical protein